MGYPFIQSVLIQALKQLWDSNHYSSVAMTQLFMCAKNHFDLKYETKSKGKLIFGTVYINYYIVSHIIQYRGQQFTIYVSYVLENTQ